MHQLSDSLTSWLGFATSFCFYVCGNCDSEITCIWTLPLASHWLWLPSKASPSLHHMPYYDKSRPFFLDRNRVPSSLLAVVCTWELSIMDQCWPFYAQAMPTYRHIWAAMVEFTLMEFWVKWLRHLSPLYVLKKAHKRIIFWASTS